MSLMDNRQMADKTPLEQAKRAIAHVLNTAAENRHLGWYLGLGTQSYALLTEAAATLFDQPIEEVREKFRCQGAINPAAPVWTETNDCSPSRMAIVFLYNEAWFDTRVKGFFDGEDYRSKAGDYLDPQPTHWLIQELPEGPTE